MSHTVLSIEDTVHRRNRDRSYKGAGLIRLSKNRTFVSKYPFLFNRRDFKFQCYATCIHTLRFSTQTDPGDGRCDKYWLSRNNIAV